MILASAFYEIIMVLYNCYTWIQRLFERVYTVIILYLITQSSRCVNPLKLYNLIDKATPLRKKSSQRVFQEVLLCLSNYT